MNFQMNMTRLRIPTGWRQTSGGYFQAQPRSWTRGYREQHQLVVRTGFEAATYGFQIRRSNHSATLSLNIILMLSCVLALHDDFCHVIGCYCKLYKKYMTGFFLLIGWLYERYRSRKEIVSWLIFLFVGLLPDLRCKCTRNSCIVVKWHWKGKGIVLKQKRLWVISNS